MTEKIEPDTTHHDGDDAEHEFDEHAPPNGTLLITVLFLLMCVFMFSWAYYLLLARV